MESEKSGRFWMKILIVVIFIFLAVINNGRGTAQKSKTSIDEVRDNRNAQDPSDIAALLNKLIRVAEDMKTKIVCEVANTLAKQSKEIKTLASDTRYSQQSIMDKMKEIENAVASSSGGSTGANQCCTEQEKDIEINQELLETIAVSVANITGMVFENGGFRKQQQNAPQRGVDPNVYTNCYEVRQLGYPSGAYRIRLDNKDKAATVYCDMDTPDGDWLVFQRRRDGSANFRQNWDAYANGFGDARGDFWLGNEILHHLTSQEQYKLRIDLEDYETQKRYAEYWPFTVGPSSDYYRMIIGHYNGTAGDSLTFHNNTQFTTYDADHDEWLLGNCARRFRGAWWYAACLDSDLNGDFHRGENKSAYGSGIIWLKFHPYTYSVRSEMKITPLNDRNK